MIKRLFYIAGGLVLAVILAVAIILVNISTIGPYIVKKITRGEVSVNKFDYSFDKGMIVLKLVDLAITGNLEGTVKRIDVLANLTSRPFLKSTTISDFDLSFADLKGKIHLVPLPAELFQIKKGTVTYNKQKIFIEDLTIENLRSGKPFHFNLKAQNDSFFKSISASGEGLYRGRSSELKGNVHITDLDLARVSGKLKGVAAVQGPFTFAKQSFTFEGPFEMSGFEVKDRVLEKPLIVKYYSGKVKIAYADNITNITIGDINFLNTTFLLHIKTGKNSLFALDLSSGFIDINRVKSYMALENLAEGSKKLWDSIHKGSVKISKFQYEDKKSVHVDLELKDVGFVYKDMNFIGVAGFLTIDNHKATISKGRGTFKTSHFSEAAGFVSLARDKMIKVKGKYSVNLRDIPYMLDVGKVKFKHGITQGVMELEGNRTSGYRISGRGTVEHADVSWQKISAKARGSYRFTHDEITFDPLILRKAGTDMVIRGKWGKKSMGIFMKGSLDVDQVRQFAVSPFPMEGLAFLDVSIQRHDNLFTLNGDVFMDNVSFTIPRFMKKDKGVKSAAHMALSVKDRRIDISRLSYNLDNLRISGKGWINPDRTVNADIGVNVQAVDRIAPLFFFEDHVPKGDLDLNIAFRDLRWPLQTMPQMRGFARVNNGFLKLPWCAEPLKEITLNAEFKGDIFEILIKRVVCGQTTVGTSRLHIQDLENPRFNFDIAMENLDVSDIKSKSESIFRAIRQDSIMARMAGDFTLHAGTVSLSNMSGTKLRVSGKLRDRKFSINQFTANVLGGYGDVTGMVDLSQDTPVISVQGKILSMTSGHLLKTLGIEARAIEGEGVATGNIHFRGEKKTDFIQTLNGQVGIYSKDGTIKKWNLLAKIFSLLNLYDLFRGKVRFTETGLKYTKMGASFKIKDGYLTTDNFVLDSPSMLITGKGTINASDNEVNGIIAVSPLVAIDKTINKIPVLRRLVRDKNRGFISASYNVKGKVTDPDISLNYVDTIGGKTINTLKNVITLPIELLERK